MFIGKPELHAAFVADQVGAFLPVAFLMFVTGETCIEAGGKIVLPVGPDKEVYPLARFLISEQVDLAVMHFAHRYSYYTVFGSDDIVLDRLFAAPPREKEY
jgi:hypothetical protein